MPTATTASPRSRSRDAGVRRPSGPAGRRRALPITTRRGPRRPGRGPDRDPRFHDAAAEVRPVIGTVRDSVTHRRSPARRSPASTCFFTDRRRDANGNYGLIQLGPDEPPPDLTARSSRAPPGGRLLLQRAARGDGPGRQVKRVDFDLLEICRPRHHHRHRGQRRDRPADPGRRGRAARHRGRVSPTPGSLHIRDVPLATRTRPASSVIRASHPLFPPAEADHRLLRGHHRGRLRPAPGAASGDRRHGHQSRHQPAAGRRVRRRRVWRGRHHRPRAATACECAAWPQRRRPCLGVTAPRRDAAGGPGRSPQRPARRTATLDFGFSSTAATATPTSTPPQRRPPPAPQELPTDVYARTRTAGVRRRRSRTDPDADRTTRAEPPQPRRRRRPRCRPRRARARPSTSTRLGRRPRPHRRRAPDRIADRDRARAPSTPTRTPTDTPPRRHRDHEPDGDPAAAATPTATSAPAACELYPIALHASTVRPPGAVVRIVDGTRSGSFGWLSWDGHLGEPSLVSVLTPPGAADPGYVYDPDDPATTPSRSATGCGVARPGQQRPSAGGAGPAEEARHRRTDLGPGDRRRGHLPLPHPTGSPASASPATGSQRQPHLGHVPRVCRLLRWPLTDDRTGGRRRRRGSEGIAGGTGDVAVRPPADCSHGWSRRPTASDRGAAAAG